MIELKNIAVTFHKGTPLENKIFRSLNLKIASQEFITIVGGNGSGKSTLMNVIAGEIIPNSGRISIDHEDVTLLPIHERSRLISRVFQDPMIGTCEKLTIEENLAFAYQKFSRSLFHKSSNRKLREKLRIYLADLGVGLEHRLKESMSLLSAGHRQVVSLIMATLNPLKILLLDEHTSALDPRMEAKVLRLTHKIIEEEKITTLMITHSMSQALEYGDRTLILKQGEIFKDFSKDERKKLTSHDLLSYLAD